MIQTCLSTSDSHRCTDMECSNFGSYQHLSTRPPLNLRPTSSRQQPATETSALRTRAIQLHPFIAYSLVCTLPPHTRDRHADRQSLSVLRLHRSAPGRSAANRAARGSTASSASDICHAESSFTFNPRELSEPPCYRTVALTNFASLVAKLATDGGTVPANVLLAVSEQQLTVPNRCPTPAHPALFSSLR